MSVLLEIKDLHVRFYTPEGVVKAVEGVNLSLEEGETLALVGESGCGKSVTARSVMRLIPWPPGKITQGSITFNSKDVLKLEGRALRAFRGGDVSMIFQEPMTSLNPVFTIGDQLTEAIIIHQAVSRAEALKRAERVLALTGIPSPNERLANFPHQLSGGMRQRVMIAMAISCNPKLLIADEPTTALDVTIQARVMSFGKPEQILVSRSYFEVISRLSQEYAKLFRYEGARADKHVREHQVYSVSPVEKEKAPPPEPPLQQKEIAGGEASTSLAQAGADGQSGKTATAEEGKPFRAPQQNPFHLVWKKLLDSWSVKRFNWNEIRNNRTMLSVAAALIVILLSVPVIVWMRGGPPAEDLRTIPSPPSIATPEVAKKAKSPAPASKQQKKTETATNVKTPATSAALSFGIAPWGEVYVDGDKKGVAPPLNNLQVAPGKHLIEIRNTSFPPYKQTVDLKPGEQLKIRHKFL